MASTSPVYRILTTTRRHLHNRVASSYRTSSTSPSLSRSTSRISTSVSIQKSHISTSSPRKASRDDGSSPSGSKNPFMTQGPAPPRLPKEEQEIFEDLQRQSTGAFSTPRTRTPPKVNQSPDSEVAPSVATNAAVAASAATNTQTENQSIAVSGEGEELHPSVRLGAKPEFEGDQNPKTGEIGGPKNEPLRWGHNGDWSYNGRVTDF